MMTCFESEKDQGDGSVNKVLASPNGIIYLRRTEYTLVMPVPGRHRQVNPLVSWTSQTSLLHEPQANDENVLKKEGRKGRGKERKKVGSL